MRKNIATIISVVLTIIVVSSGKQLTVSAHEVEARNCSHPSWSNWQVVGQWYDRDPNGAVTDCSIRTTEWKRYCKVCGYFDIDYTLYPLEHNWQYDYNTNMKYCTQQGCGVWQSIDPISLN